MSISRLLLLFLLAAAVAGVVAPSAGALTFPDEICPVATGTVIKVCPQGETGKSYSLQIKGRDGTGCVPFVTFRSIGTLPPGLTMSSSGLISGTPTQQGEYVFWIEMKDVPASEGGVFWCSDDNSTEKQFSITIVQGLQIVQRQSTLTPGQLNTPYSLQFSTIGGASATWSVSGSLPAGVTLNTSNGLLSGTPTAAGDYTFQITATNGSRSDTQTYSLAVVPKLTIATLTPAAEVGLPFTLTLKATGGRAPYQWSATGLPAGLTLDQATGVITGVPTAVSSATVTATVTDALGLTSTVDVRFPVAAKLAIRKRLLPTAKIGVRYVGGFKAIGGVGPFKWVVLGSKPGTLPPGLKLNTKTGRLSGVPTKAGTYRLRMQVTDKLGVKSAAGFVLKVSA